MEEQCSIRDEANCVKGWRRWYRARLFRCRLQGWLLYVGAVKAFCLFDTLKVRPEYRLEMVGAVLNEIVHYLEIFSTDTYKSGKMAVSREGESKEVTAEKCRDKNCNLSLTSPKRTGFKKLSLSPSFARTWCWLCTPNERFAQPGSTAQGAQGELNELFLQFEHTCARRWDSCLINTASVQVYRSFQLFRI